MIEVKKYNPQWSNRFQSLSSKFYPHIEDIVEEVLHVGSTSVKGMSAKPIIDIDIVVEDFANFNQLCNKLELAGYRHSGDQGIKDSEAFVHTKDIAHQLYVVKKDSLALKNHLLLKKHLEENPAALKEYSDLKLKFSKNKITTEKYWKAKTAMILSFLAAEGLSEEELSEIQAQN